MEGGGGGRGGAGLHRPFEQDAMEFETSTPPGLGSANAGGIGESSYQGGAAAAGIGGGDRAGSAATAGAPAVAAAGASAAVSDGPRHAPDGPGADSRDA